MNISLMKKLIELSQKNAFQKNIIMQISVRFQYSQINKALAHKRYIFLDMYYCIVYTTKIVLSSLSVYNTCTIVHT